MGDLLHMVMWMENAPVFTPRIPVYKLLVLWYTMCINKLPQRPYQHKSDVYI